ncbi:hypothetical protein C8J56DRAFT_179396 [Mycena floridula]|nr:hypothetical protein C8J56DRAFT_179396 [Mycena floridula]
MLRRRGDSLTNPVDNILRRSRGDSVPNSAPPSSYVAQPPMYANASKYRSLLLEVLVYSPSVIESGFKRLPVFGENDVVSGKVMLDTTGPSSGRVTVSIQGAFLYTDGVEFDSQRSREHVFFVASTVIPISPFSDSCPAPRSALREAFSGGVKRQPSLSSLNGPSSPRSDRFHPFSFQLPRGARSREEIPPTFTGGNSPSFSIEYKIFASWHPADPNDPSSQLEIPFLFQPDADFESLDGRDRDSWLEMPLRADRPMPFKCAVTLPTSVTFSRGSSIPYFVVFGTTPRSSSLAREIAADATISVSLQRQITIMEQVTLPPSPPATPSSSSDDSYPERPNLFKRVVKHTRSVRNLSQELVDKPLPRLPTQSVFSDMTTLQNSICIGFPKRPRQQYEGKHPPLDTHSSLPDGLLRSKFYLTQDTMPSIDWAGLSVKYYLEVSVMVGQENLFAKIPIRII